MRLEQLDLDWNSPEALLRENANTANEAAQESSDLNCCEEIFAAIGDDDELLAAVAGNYLRAILAMPDALDSADAQTTSVSSLEPVSNGGGATGTDGGTDDARRNATTSIAEIPMQQAVPSNRHPSGPSENLVVSQPFPISSPFIDENELEAEHRVPLDLPASSQLRAAACSLGIATLSDEFIFVARSACAAKVHPVFSSNESCERS